MNTLTSNHRILFFDLLRAFAVLMMVEGHTVHACLLSEYFNTSYIAFNIWNFLRGFTAPIFMFTSGCVFAFLLNGNGRKSGNNPRVKKGIKRFIQLLIIGYLLRYPTYKIFDFSSVTTEGWRIFFAVDALHLIGIGIFILTLNYLISKKIRLNFLYLNLFISILILTIYPFVIVINWVEILPMPLAAYLSNSTGSIFPLFPWLFYVLLGGTIGIYFSKKNISTLNKSKDYRILFFGMVLVLLSLILKNIDYDITRLYFIIFLRSGVVLVLIFIFQSVAQLVSPNLKLFAIIGKNTLLIYSIHVIILYGCAWLPGIYKFYGNKFTVAETFLAVIIMESAMIILVYYIERLKIKKNVKLVADES